MFLFLVLLSFVARIEAQTLPFTVPFDTKSYTGSLQFVSGSIGAVAYFRLDEKFAYFGIASNTNGWVAFGLNDNAPSMPGADIFMCRQGAGAAVGVVDMFAPTLGMPVSDANDDLTLDKAGRANGITYCVFSRPRETCNDLEDVPIVDASIVLNGLLAFGSSDELTYHGPANRRSQQFTFSKPLSAMLETDVVMTTVAAPTHTVPTTSSSYGCSYHDLGQAPLDPNTKYHVVQYALIRGSSVAEGVLHHVSMSGCDSAVAGYASGAVGPCEVLMAKCSRTLLSSGYLPEGTILPSDSGIPILGTGVSVLKDS